MHFRAVCFVLYIGAYQYTWPTLPSLLAGALFVIWERGVGLWVLHASVFCMDV